MAEVNHTKWVNEEFDKLVDEGARETDPAKRKEIYLQAEKLLKATPTKIKFTVERHNNKR